MKIKFYLLFIVLFSTQATFAGICGSSLKNDRQFEIQNTQQNKMPEPKSSFGYENLPQDLKNKIIEFAWGEYDNTEKFTNDLLESPWNEITLSPKGTSYELRSIPLYFYILQSHKQQCIVKKIGNLKEQFEIMSSELARLLLNNDESILSTKIKSHLTIIDLHILAASFSVLGDIAITWHDKNEKKTRVTFVHVNDVKQKKEIDLDHNAITLKKIPLINLKNQKNTQVKSLFSLDGSQLAVCSMHSDKYLDLGTQKSIEFIDAPSKDKALTIYEKAKRLEGFLTAEQWKSLKEKKQ